MFRVSSDTLPHTLEVAFKQSHSSLLPAVLLWNKTGLVISLGSQILVIYVYSNG